MGFVPPDHAVSTLIVSCNYMSNNTDNITVSSHKWWAEWREKVFHVVSVEVVFVINYSRGSLGSNSSLYVRNS